MKKEQKIDYKAKFENLHAEYKKLQKLLLVNQNFADNLKKELEKLKNENIEQSCKIICSYAFISGVIECYEKMLEMEKEFDGASKKHKERLLNEKDTQKNA